MSRSRNVWSKYSYVPEHVQASINTKSSSIKNRTRDKRAKEKRELQILVQSITLGGNDE